MSSKQEVGNDIISEFKQMAVRHQNELNELITHLSAGVEQMGDAEECSMSKWAANEIKIACARERDPDLTDDEWDYGVECYKSAMRAYSSLIGDGHSLYSIECTKHILISLIEGRPLTPIDDIDDQWNNVSDYGLNNGVKSSFQHSRYSSLFKNIMNDGTVNYTDVENHYCTDINDHGSAFHSSVVQKVIDDMFPITFPYYPKKKMKVCCEFYGDAFRIVEIIDGSGIQNKINKFYGVTENGEVIKLHKLQWLNLKASLISDS